MAAMSKKAAVLGLMLLALCTFQRHGFHVTCATVRQSFASLAGASSAAPKIEGDEPVEVSDVGPNETANEVGDTTHVHAVPRDILPLHPLRDPEVEEPESVGYIEPHSSTSGRCLSGSDRCRASVLRSLRVDVMVENLRLHRWSFRTASNAPVTSNADAAASGSVEELTEPGGSGSAMSSDELDLFFPDEGPYEDAAAGETVILQLQA